VRTVYLGTSWFAVAVLERLAGSPHRPALVVTRPDRPRGRGRRLSPPPVAEAARELNLDLAQPESVNGEDARERIAAAAPDVVCVCAFGALIKQPLLSDYLMLNVHPSLLPRWRGAAPVERAIMAGDQLTGVSIMRVTAGLDSGPVYAQRPEPIQPTDTYGTLAPRLEQVGGKLLVDVLGAVEDGGGQPVEQDHASATYAEKVVAEDRRLDPAQPAGDLERRVRALTPHIGAYLDLPELGHLIVLDARAVPGVEEAEPGAVVARERQPLLSCGEGALELVTVKPAGRRAMAGAEWLRGRRR
jgi:methionyl-tRNA formyltransferase